MNGKKEEIITTTADLIQFKGYESTKLSDIMRVSGIGKGQFYHYFSSKRDLGLHVVDYYISKWRNELIRGIFNSKDSAESKIDNMLKWAVQSHDSPSKLSGCPFGNLALEMSEHDEAFRVKINELFHEWINSLAHVLRELQGDEKSVQKARSIVAQIEGGILLTKNYQDPSIMKDIIEAIRTQYLTKQS